MSVFSILPLVLCAQVASPFLSSAEGGVSDDPEVGLPGHASEEWGVHLVAGDRTRIVVQGSGASDLDVYLLDERGLALAADEALADFCVLDFTPEESGLHLLRVVNRGRISNAYDLSIVPVAGEPLARLLSWLNVHLSRLVRQVEYRQQLVLRIATGFGVPGGSERLPLALEAMAELSRIRPQAGEHAEEAPSLAAEDPYPTCPVLATESCPISF